MKVAFWNRLKGAPAGEQAAWLSQSCELRCPTWDVLLLAEVRAKDVEAFRSGLEADAAAAWTDGIPPRSGQPHGMMAFSRIGPLTGVEYPSQPITDQPSIDDALVEYVESRRTEPWPARQPLAERWIAFQVESEGRQVSIAGAQMPFAAGKDTGQRLHNRLSKREAYRQLTE